jgi:ferritin-like metal-binding protein YciE
MPDTLHDQLTSYLTDAHSIEEQAIAQLDAIPSMPGAEHLRSVLVGHLAETQGHEQIVKELLADRDAKPSWFKDAVMKVGGKGFILFARANQDTPGKLLAHAYSYEALEEASYALLGHVAEFAGEDDVVVGAQRIEAEEAAMKERLADCFDEGADASLAALDPSDLQAQVAVYLADAHAIEQQSITVLERASKQESGSLATTYEDHLVETRAQAERIEARLASLGHDGSSLKDAALRMAGMNWTAFFEAHPDTPGKVAAFAYALEHLEIGGYEQLRRVAERADDHETAELALRNLNEERAAATALYGLFPEAARLALAAKA